jgi:excinuclease ABC subunit B
MSSTSIADVRKKDTEKEVSAFMKVSEPVVKYMTNEQKNDLIEQLNHEMINAAKDLEFERAAALRDEIEKLKKLVK